MPSPPRFRFICAARWTAPCLLAWALVLAAPELALACGGCCWPGPDPVVDEGYVLTPVNTRAAQLLFEVEPDGEHVSAHIMINYQGDPSEFAWIVPAPGVPELSLSHQEAFSIVGDITAPDIKVDDHEPCPDPEYVCAYHDWPSCPAPEEEAEDDWGSLAESSPEQLDTEGEEPNSEPVEIISREILGSYETILFTADDASAAVSWLRTEGFMVNQGLAPSMQSYADQGMAFVVARLVPDAGVDEIRPLRIRYEGSRPMIPLRISAFSAEPEMTVTSYIFANRAHVPVDRALAGISPTWISRTPAGRINYPAVLSRAVDDAGGDGFLMEYAGAPSIPQRAIDTLEPENWQRVGGNEFCCGEGVEECFGPAPASDGICVCPDADFDAEDCADIKEAAGAVLLLERLAGYRSLTRLTTRLSAHEMTFDPEFEPASAGVALEGKLSLTGRYAHLGRCVADVVDDEFYASMQQLQNCTATHCGGGGGECAATAQGAGCVCPEGEVGRAFQDLDGETSITCVPAGQSALMEIDGVPVQDPCQAVSCGELGSCRVQAAIPTCECEAGAAAVLDPLTGLPTCVAVERLSGESGARDFTASIDEVRVCAPAPAASCGAYGWLVPNPSTRIQGVICETSLPSGGELFSIPSEPTCGVAEVVEERGLASTTAGSPAILATDLLPEVRASELKNKIEAVSSSCQLGPDSSSARGTLAWLLLLTAGLAWRRRLARS